MDAILRRYLEGLGYKDKLERSDPPGCDT
jgi:hypothetical protein